jgi:hypothetical protein
MTVRNNRRLYMDRKVANGDFADWSATDDDNLFTKQAQSVRFDFSLSPQPRQPARYSLLFCVAVDANDSSPCGELARNCLRASGLTKQALLAAMADSSLRQRRDRSNELSQLLIERSRLKEQLRQVQNGRLRGDLDPLQLAANNEWRTVDVSKDMGSVELLPSTTWWLLLACVPFLNAFLTIISMGLFRLNTDGETAVPECAHVTRTAGVVWFGGAVVPFVSALLLGVASLLHHAGDSLSDRYDWFHRVIWHWYEDVLLRRLRDICCEASTENLFLAAAFLLVAFPLCFGPMFTFCLHVEILLLPCSFDDCVDRSPWQSRLFRASVCLSVGLPALLLLQYLSLYARRGRWGAAAVWLCRRGVDVAGARLIARQWQNSAAVNRVRKPHGRRPGMAAEKAVAIYCADLPEAGRPAQDTVAKLVGESCANLADASSLLIADCCVDSGWISGRSAGCPAARLRSGGVEAGA